jgi:transcriptional regulator with XRE-family HTH domain
MPALPLNASQLQDADRLVTLFKEWQASQRASGLPSSQEAAAHLLGFGQSALSQYLKGRIPLNVDVLVKFAHFLDCTPADISGDLAKKIQVIAGAAENDPNAEFVTVRRVDVRLSAGKGNVVLSEDEKSRLSFRADFLASAGAGAEHSVSVSVDGQSMEPTLPDKSIILINVKAKSIVNGKIYAFRCDGKLLVKRLHKKGAEIVAKSDNPDFEDIDIGLHCEDFEVIGRAFWMGTKL